ncbi:COG4705 family protein [Sphingomonas oryzagri]
MTAREARDALSKVPAVTLGFWIIKIAATTLGETGGDTVSMTMNLGYLVGTAIFATLLVAFVTWQIRATRFHPALYWATIIASTTAGTTMADFADRSLGIGYPGGTTLLFLCVLGSLAAWHYALGSVSVDTVRTPKAEIFYWVTITFSQTLGTALGDWIADAGLGYEGGALVFAAGLLLLVAAYFWTSVSRVTLFWAAFILTRPLGATVGDLLDKPTNQGGLAFSRPLASAILAVFIIGCIWLLPQRAGRHSGEDFARE